MNILEEIKVFFNQPNSVGALLLTGKWGCGKTFFIENTLIGDKEIFDKFILIRVSLFGETSSMSINTKIKKEYLLKRFPIKTNNKVFKATSNIFKKGTSALACIIPIFGAIDTVISADWLDFIEVEGFEGKDIVLVFDDLERCNMNIQDILGCLNEYVETKKIKTIIIADENIIRLKDTPNEKDDSDTIINNMTYDVLKEKLIYRTIRLVPEHSDIVESVLQCHKESEKGFKEFVYSSRDLICRTFEESKTNNIRSLKCAIQDFERIYKRVKEYDFDVSVMRHLLSSFLPMVFEYKAGRLEMGEYGFLFADHEIGEKYINFNTLYVLEPVRQWVITGEWDESSLDNAINKMSLALKKEEPKDLILRNFLLDIDDTTLNMGYPAVLHESYEAFLSFDEYIKLIKIRLESRYYGIELPVEADLNRVLIGVKTRVKWIKEGEIEEPNGHALFVESDFNNLVPEEKAIIREVSLYRTYHQHIKNRCELIKALKENNRNIIYNCFDKYIQSFDLQLAKATFDYYSALENSERRSFGIELSKAWRTDWHISRTDIEESIKGFELLKKCILENGCQERIKTAIDQKFSENLDGLIKIYKENLGTHECEPASKAFSNVVILDK